MHSSNGSFQERNMQGSTEGEPPIVEVPDDDFCTYVNKLTSTTYVCSTTNAPYKMDSQWGFSTKTCLVYAEDIELSRDLIFHGKTLGIFCSRLTMTKPSIAIDVSGNAGASQDPAMSSDGLPGNPGSPGGSIMLFIERLTTANVDGIVLKADGGDGGPGQDAVTYGYSGGPGGPGGDGGSISYAFGSTAHSTLTTLYRSKYLPWPLAADSLKSSVIPLLRGLVPQGFPEARVKPFTETVDRYQVFATTSREFITEGNLILTIKNGSSTRQPSTSVTEAVSKLSSALDLLLKAKVGPDLEDKIPAEACQNATALVKAWLALSSKTTDSELIEALTKAGSIPMDPDWALRAKTADAFEILTQVQGDMEYTTRVTMSSASKGYGGRGGTSGNAEIPPGKQGPHGKPGIVQSMNLSLDGSLADLNVAQPYASPEQCQMLLNKADGFFFTRSPASSVDAALLYKRLTERLAFVPTLKAAVTKVPPTPNPLMDAYNGMEFGLKVTLSAVSQLESIYNQATSRVNQLLAGQDLFGYELNWVPRLTYEYYRARIVELVGLVEKAEAVETAYVAALKSQSSAAGDIKDGMAATARGKEQAQARIDLLASTNGPISTNAYQIEHFSPILKSKRLEIKEKVEKVSFAIQNHLGLNPQTIIDSLVTICFSPSLPMIGVEGANVVYNSWTQISDDTGVPVNKKYVLQELGNAGDSLQTLTEAFNVRSDHTLDPDDPGAIKLLTEAANIEKLLKQFEDAIPADDRESLKVALKEYTTMAVDRNRSINSYNAALELLHQAYIDKKYNEGQYNSLAQTGIESIDSNLPSICYWLRKSRDTLRLDVMQRQALASRAIHYWGLAFDLQENINTLDNAFEDALLDYAGTYPSRWPSLDKQGFTYKLSPSEVFSLSIFSVFVKQFTPETRSTGSTIPVLANKSNIRLTQIRFWLIGVEVTPDQSDRQIVSVDITMMGQETIVRSDRVAISFSHDPVSLTFVYDNAGIDSVKDCLPARQIGSEDMGNAYTGMGPLTDRSVAPVGPFATWKIELRASANENLNLEGVTEAYVEFCGMSGPFVVATEEEEAGVAAVQIDNA